MRKNWKTTLAGIALALCGVLSKQPGTLGTIGTIGSTIGVVTLGAVAKDSDVTGGTREQDSPQFKFPLA